MTRTNHHQVRLWGKSGAQRRATAAAIAAGATVLVAIGAAAAPTPDSGPTVGGTTVEIDCADFGFDVVEAGTLNALLISKDGRIFTWGDTNFGALGGSGGTAYPAQIATGAIPAGTTFVDAAVGQWAGYGLTDTGAVYSWGMNLSGELGDGSFPAVSESNQPVLVSQGEIPAGVTAVDVVAGSGNVAIIGSDGWAYAWGNGNSGINGDGTTAWYGTPQAIAQGQIPAGVTIEQYSIGNSTAYVLGSDGWVYSWGYRGFGAVGDGLIAPLEQRTPVRLAQGAVPAGVTFTHISAGDNTAYALGTDGNIYSWGQNFYGQLGNGASGVGTEVFAPVLVARGEVPAGVTFVSVDADAGAETAVAVGSDGELYTWGQGTGGGLGNGSTAHSPVPVQVHQGGVPAGVNLTKPVVAMRATFAIGTDGAMYSWGGLQGPQYLGSNASAGTMEPSFGAAFRVTEVTFEGIPGTNLDASGCPITVVTPPHVAGPVDVSVNTSLIAGTLDTWATSSVTYPGGFTYIEAPLITTPSLPDGTIAVGYSSPVEATGTGPITFALGTGSLPPGLTLDPATGLISGTPTQVGAYTFTVTATNSVGSDEREYTIVIDSGATPTPTQTPTQTPTPNVTPTPTPSPTATGAATPSPTPSPTDSTSPTATPTDPSTSPSDPTDSPTDPTTSPTDEAASPSETASVAGVYEEAPQDGDPSADGGSGSLAWTGSEGATRLLVAGVAMLLAGGALVLFVRARRAL